MTWQRPAWTTAPRARWLCVSLLAHGLAIGGVLGLGRRPPVVAPRIVVHQVLDGEPAAAPAPEPRPDLAVAIEETVPPAPFDPRHDELPAAPMPEPPPPPPPPDLRRTAPRAVFDGTIVKQRALPPRPAVAAPVAPPSDPGSSVEPVPLDDCNAPPRYPPRAIELRLEGTVLLRITVDAGGTVSRCAIARSSGHGLLDHAAITAVATWRFRGGPGELELPIEFVLRRRAPAADRQPPTGG